MSTLDPTLTEHAARLLTGTNVTVDTAVAIASGQQPAPGPVAAALRDGWDAADSQRGSDQP